MLHKQALFPHLWMPLTYSIHTVSHRSDMQLHRSNVYHRLHSVLSSQFGVQLCWDNSDSSVITSLLWERGCVRVTLTAVVSNRAERYESICLPIHLLLSPLLEQDPEGIFLLINSPHLCYFLLLVFMQMKIKEFNLSVILRFGFLQFDVFACQGITENLLAQFSWNLVEGCSVGQGRTH